jgi:hypothetical protein
VWLAISLVFLLGLAFAARHPAQETETPPAEQLEADCHHDILSPETATSRHHA